MKAHDRVSVHLLIARPSFRSSFTVLHLHNVKRLPFCSSYGSSGEHCDLPQRGFGGARTSSNNLLCVESKSTYYRTAISLALNVRTS